MTPPNPEPAVPEDLADWLHGSRTLAQAQRDSGLSRQRLWALMDSGVVRFRVVDERGTRIVAWLDVVKYVASLPTESPEPAGRNALGGRINRKAEHAGTGVTGVGSSAVSTPKKKGGKR